MKNLKPKFEMILSPYVLSPKENEERLEELAILLVDAFLDRRDSPKIKEKGESPCLK